jgi:hypothetical protein
VSMPEAIAEAMRAREALQRSIRSMDESIGELLRRRRLLGDALGAAGVDAGRRGDPLCGDAVALPGALACDLDSGHGGEHEVIAVLAGKVVRVTWEDQ